MDVQTWPSSAEGRVLDHHVDPYKVDILEGYDVVSGGVDLGGVVACCSMGGLAQERIRVAVVGSHMDVTTCGSLGGQVGMGMVRGEVALDHPYAYAEVEGSKSGLEDDGEGELLELER